MNQVCLRECQTLPPSNLQIASPVSPGQPQNSQIVLPQRLATPSASPVVQQATRGAGVQARNKRRTILLTDAELLDALRRERRRDRTIQPPQRTPSSSRRQLLSSSTNVPNNPPLVPPPRTLSTRSALVRWVTNENGDRIPLSRLPPEPRFKRVLRRVSRR